MIGYRDIQEYATTVENDKEQAVIKRIQNKIDTMLGYRTDKVVFEKDRKCQQ